MSKTIILLVLALLPGTAALAAHSGEHLYQQNCSICHGFNGNGGVGVPLSLEAFQTSVSDEYLARTIRNGRPGRIMPAFRHLTEKEIKAIIGHIRSWSDQPAPTFSNEPVEGDVEHGRQLFARHCAVCHGADGKGGPGTGVTMSRPRSLPILAPALNNSGFLASAPDAMIKYTLMNGRKGTPMASFLEKGLSEQDIDDVVAYIRSFETELKKADDEKKSAEQEPAVFISESPYSVEETVENLVNAVESNNFRLIRIQNLETGVVDEGKEDKGQVIVYSCNFNLLNEALKIDPRIGLFLPCRVTVFKRGDKVLVMAVNPKRMSAVFNNDELNKVCTDMQEVYRNMIDEALF